MRSPVTLLQTEDTTRAPLSGGTRVAAILCFLLLGACPALFADQTVELKGDAGGKRFDGIGAVSGGGATSVLLKDYPETRRNQILDLLFKPKFGAAISALLVEVPGDGNSTQGSEPSHMHTRGDANFSRGYEWWLMREAKKRNPDLTLDACAWGCPAWVGGGTFWSQDMADYYVSWVKGLKSVYGLDLDAIGCRNEKGVGEDFAKKLRATLNANGLEKVRVHGFDNWGKTKFDWVKDLDKDADLRAAVDILSNHTMSEIPASDDVQKISSAVNKPIWNTEEHVYKEGFDCEISLVKAFNDNYIASGVTKIVNWYLVGSTYRIEPFAELPAAMIANTPWSGHYYVRDVLWGYAHYGQFSQVGWQYVKGACDRLSGGGTFVTLKAPTGGDYSIIAETKDATAAQAVTFEISGGLATGRLCVWRSNEAEQFVRQSDITPANGSFTIILQPQSIYSMSTTTGQQKGSFADVPADTDFPFPYFETFDTYASPAKWGFLPHYTADICGVFEIADRPDKAGKCLRQIIDHKAQSWAPEWMPYTIIGDRNWSDYEVSADIYLDDGGWAGVMGRVNDTGTGYGCIPKGYYMRLAADGACSLYVATQDPGAVAGNVLATGKVSGVAGRQWHNVSLRFVGTTITAFVDGVQVLHASDATYPRGMAGLITGGDADSRNTACFDNLSINAVGAGPVKPTVFAADQLPMY
jgi:galactosylceramidase